MSVNRLVATTANRDVDCRRFASDNRHGDHIELIHHMGEHPLPIGTGLKVIGRNGFFEEKDSYPFDQQVRSAVGAVVAEGEQTLRRVYVDAILLVRKVRPAGAARRQNKVGIATVGGNPDQISISSLAAIEFTVFTIVGIPTQRYDLGSIRRPRWIAVHAKDFDNIAAFRQTQRLLHN